MTRNVGVSIENAFTRGLITEVTGVNSPENSVTISSNTIYDRIGRAKKRKGFEIEPGAVYSNIGGPGVRLEYLWETVSDNVSVDFVVLQIGSMIHFFGLSSGLPLSASRKSFTVNLLSYKSPQFPDSVIINNFCSFSSGRGALFIAHPNCSTLYVSYNSVTDSLSVKTIAITVRDFEGVEDGYGLTQRRTSLTTAHRYNLFNQGWYGTFRTGSQQGNANLNVLTAWDNERSDFPAHSDVWWYYIRTDQSGLEFLSPALATRNNLFYGNTPAAKGHYIINPFQTNRSSVSGISGVTEKSSDGLRPSVVSFYAGRAFYGGVGKSGYSSKIYFTQIIERDEQLGYCYQANDPTSRDISDLLDSDGGVIEIADINNVLDLKVVGQSMIVLASNGIWSISGTDNGPFRATDYTVSKISNIPAISKTSSITISGTPLWWNYEGIFTLSDSELGLTKDVTSLTTSTIQRFYDSIPSSCKLYAKGAFNNQEKLAYWIYSSDDDNPSVYDSVLVLDAISGAFYPITLPTQGPKLTGLVSVRQNEAIVEDSDLVTNLLDLITTNTGSQVYIEEFQGYVFSDQVFKFVTEDGTNLTFSDISSERYLDWNTYPYDSFFVTGYRVRGEILKKSQTNYLSVITEDIEEGSCYVQPIWDYSNDHDSGRFGNPQQVYRSKTFRDYQRSKIKIRGNGYSLQFKFYGVSGKPYVITGWAGFDSTTGVP